MTPSHDIRALSRIDAGFEAALGTVLNLGGALGWLTGADFPVDPGVIIGVGCSLLAASVSTVLYFAPRAPRRVLLELALGNAVMAAGGLVWLLADRGFSTLGAVVLGVFVVWKASISTLQLRSQLVSGAPA